MSKIEKALSRAQGERSGLQLVPAPGVPAAPATGTALVAERVAHPETIARMAAREARLLGPADLAARGIIHKDFGGDASVQAFRELRTRILQRSKGGNGVILVTGVGRRNGSSFVAQNLAASFAFDIVRTALVVDCNLKNPSLHRLISRTALKGLSDYLESPHVDISEIIHPVGIARFRLIPAGSHKVADVEHLGSDKMRRLVQSLRTRYAERFVILDGPPMAEIADIRILSEFADYVLMVARYGHATRGQIERSLSAIGGEKLLGIVFNDEPRIPWMR